MNIVLDVLRLRRVRLDYVSPPICQVILSGSGSSLMIEAAEFPAPPFGMVFSGQCERFLTWSSGPGVVCTSLYKAINPSDPLTKYAVEVDCVPNNGVSLCSDGWWQYSTLTPDGVESARSTPILVPVSGVREILTVVKPLGAVRFNLFRNPNVNDPNGTYSLVLSSVAPGAIEVCDLTGCYRLQVVSDDGASELSAPICHTTFAGCIPSVLANILGPTEDCCLNTPYSSQFEVVGGAGPFLWELVSGSVPPGLTFHTGLFLGVTAPIDGTPITAGTFSFTVRCTDVSGHTLEKTFTISILGLDQTGALPDATTDTLYNQVLTASGGTAPYTISLESGTLPTGISLIAGGVITGTPGFTGLSSFNIKVTDSENRECVSALTLAVVGCPIPGSYPVIANTGQTALNYSAFDAQRRIIWFPRSAAVNPLTDGVWLLDTQAKAWAGNATDTNGFISGGNEGFWANGKGIPVIDTKYNTCVVGGAQTGGGSTFYSFFDLDTKDCVDCVANTNVPTEFDQIQPAYDAVRGYVYTPTNPLSALAVAIFDCQPGVRTGISTHASGGGVLGGKCAYVPDTDTLYIGNTNGGTLYHKWDPATKVFTLNQGPAGSGGFLKYFPGSKRLMVQNGADMVFIDPINGDAVLGTATPFHINPVSGCSENTCTGEVYVSIQELGGNLFSIDPNTFAITMINHVAGESFYSNAFDPLANLLFALRTDGGLTVPTY